MTPSIPRMILETVIEKCNTQTPIRAVQVTIPSLSLDHQSSCDDKSNIFDSTTTTDASMSSSNNNNIKQKVAAEKLAISLLSRPITVSKELEIDPSTSSVESSTKFLVDACTSTVNDVVCTLLQNVIPSFTTLVNSRIHAYAKFLHRHAKVLSCTSTIENEDRFSSSSSYYGPSDGDDDESSEHSMNDHKLVDTIPNDYVGCVINKIEAILHTGDELSVRTKSISFELCTTSHQGNDDIPESGNVRFVLTIGFQLPTDVTTFQNTDSHYSLTVSAPGNIQASYDDRNEIFALNFNIDTKKLLHSMIQEASNVVSKANEVANSSHTTTPNCHPVSSSSYDGILVSEHKDRCHMNRTASFLCMPPPPPKVPSCIKRNIDTMNMSMNMCIPTSTAVDESYYNCKPNQTSGSSIFRMGLDLLCEAAAVSESRIVTPDLKALPSSSYVVYSIPSLVLEDSILPGDDVPVAAPLSGQDKDKGADTTSSLSLTDVSCLSPDQCAKIIDTCLFETNSAFDFFLPPLKKRQKLSENDRGGSFSEISSTSFQPISAT